MSIYCREVTIDLDKFVKTSLKEYINQLNFELKQTGDDGLISFIKKDEDIVFIIESNDPLTKTMFPEEEKKK